MTAGALLESPSRSQLPTSFGDWRGHLDRERIAPVIAVAGSRGKTSVVRAVESILDAGGFRFASWTNRGVEIEGEGQRGELGPWSRAMTRLGAGGLDVAIQELDWATVQTIGAPDSIYPVVAIANLCGNSDACLATPETLLAMRSLKRVRTSVAASGQLILNANDFDLLDDADSESAGRYLVGVSPDAPALRRHIMREGDACWVEESTLVIHEAGVTSPVVELSELTWARDGGIPFAVQNALIATAISRSCGLAVDAIARGLASHVARPETMPGSFNVFETGSATIVIDRPMPSWFLRPALRATANLGPGRQIRTVGPMPNVSADDLAEVGRLLGRQSGVMVVHGQWDEDRMAALRHGAAANEVPPIFMQAPNERNAVQQAMAMLRAGDVLMILAEDAQAAVRLVSGRVRRKATLKASIGAA